MTNRFQHLEKEFNIDSIDANEHESKITELTDALQNAEDINNSFRKLNAFDRHDSEMDELAALAITAHKELQELGMNVEIRNAGEIFSSSSQMLKIAVDAKNLKVEKKLKLLKLQLDKLKIDNISKKENDDSVDGDAIVMDRNQLLRQLNEINKEED